MQRNHAARQKIEGRSSKAKHFKVIACKVLARELYQIAAQSDAIVDIELVEQQLHNTPEWLHESVQNAIDAAEASNESYDAILLAYGLCSNGTVGLQSAKTPLVIPRAHDCTALFLGSKERYRTLFDEANGGIYWFTPGWVECCIMPGPEREAKLLETYTEKFGEDNAEYLVEMERGWAKEYKRAFYVEWPSIRRPHYIDMMREGAEVYGWESDVIEGSDTLLEAFLSGHWDEERFLVIQPGQSIQPSYSEVTIVKAQ